MNASAQYYRRVTEILAEVFEKEADAMERGEKCDLLSKLAATGAFPMTEEEMNALLDPSLYTGRCAEQVERYVSEISPLFAEASEEGADISV